MVTRALVAELQGNEWSVPPLPGHGINVNPIDDILSRELTQEEVQRKFFEDYTAYIPMNAVSFSKLVAWHVKERLWNGAERMIILLPKVVLTSLVEEVKEPLKKEGRDVGHLTTGDIMVAWMFKVSYVSQACSATHKIPDSIFSGNFPGDSCPLHQSGRLSLPPCRSVQGYRVLPSQCLHPSPISTPFCG